MKKRSLFPALVMLLCFLLALSRLESGQRAEGKQQLEEAARRAAVTCYAGEGFYPPDVAYMQAHYGLQWQEDRYTIRYERFADNLMPEITVLERCVWRIDIQN